ncbi:MAG: hypothetical protein OEU68_00610 [Nitrospira sp.]|nr:hypothetical protein [Nitrospira sp.]MDH4242980.1 hypothetical protein [Nitrospira sp.]MDH4354393.1 hypothetical protein [Nitrospira sp.]MDH5317190.1 hypothetical protein [Nitrospira sp.]
METMKRRTYASYVTTGALGLALIGLAACSSGDDTGTLTPDGSAGLSGPIAFVNNTGDRSLTSVALRGDSNSAVLNTIPNTTFGNLALGDMQFTSGEWVFVNISGINDGQNNSQNVGTKVAALDPINSATPIHRTNLPTGVRPVHIYRDPTNGEVIWSMNDTITINTTTPGDDTINCNNPNRVGGPVEGGSVTIIHNSHQGPGAHDPEIEATVCLLADGHKVTAFSQPTATDATIPRRAFVSSEIAGEVAVIDNEPNSSTKYQMIRRIDMCNPQKETCNPENPTGTTAFTPNDSAPHGIRWSKLTGKVYSIQEGYGEIAEIDPKTFDITNRIDLTSTPYTSFGISPDGRFLLLRGDTTPPTGTKLGVIDLGTANNPRTDFTIPELAGTSPGTFKFSPDGKRFYILAGNAATATKKDRLFAFDASTLVPAAPAAQPALTLLAEIQLLQTGGHGMDVLAQGASGAGEAKYIVVSNTGTPGSVTIINATDNSIKQHVGVGSAPNGVLVYYPGAAAAGNQATN